jgi:hypothetical protein
MRSMERIVVCFALLLTLIILSSCGTSNLKTSSSTTSTTRLLSLTGWTQVDGYGDSRTAGCDASSVAMRYLNQLAKLVGVSNPNNYAVSSTETANSVVEAFNHGFPVATNLQVWSPGVNDAGFAHAGPYEATFKKLWIAGVTWLTIPSSAKYTGASFSSIPDNWTLDTTYATVTGLETSTRGATALFSYYTINTTQQPVLWYGCVNGDTGTFTVTDSAGGSAVTLSTSPAVPIWMLTSANGVTNNADNASVCAQIMDVSNRTSGLHSIKVQVTSTTGSVHIYGVGVPPASLTGTPFVLAFMPYRFLNSVLEENRAPYKQDIADSCSLLEDYGFNVACVDPDNYVMGTSTGSAPEYWSGTGTPPYECNAGIPDVTGYAVHGCDTIQNELVEAAQGPLL